MNVALLNVQWLSAGAPWRHAAVIDVSKSLCTFANMESGELTTIDVPMEDNASVLESLDRREIDALVVIHEEPTAVPWPLSLDILTTVSRFARIQGGIDVVLVSRRGILRRIADAILPTGQTVPADGWLPAQYGVWPSPEQPRCIVPFTRDASVEFCRMELGGALATAAGRIVVRLGLWKILFEHTLHVGRLS